MRVFATFVTILILGILRSTIAEIRISTGSQLINEESEFSDTSEPTTTSEVSEGSIESFLRNKCEKNGGPTAYDTFRMDSLSLSDCFQSALGAQQILVDVETALRYGEWNAFFKTYCHKLPALKLCFSHATDSIMPCLEPEEQKGAEVQNNVTSSSLDFICQDDGRRMASFVTTGGVECLSSKKETLLACLNETFTGRHQMTDPRDIFASFKLGPEMCADIEKFQRCTIAVMQTCRDQTPSSIMESLFDFYKREISCDVAHEEPTTSAPDNTSEFWTSTTPREYIPSEVEETPEDLVRRKCESNGGPKAYETFKESARLVLDSYGLVANSSEISYEMSTAAPGEEMVNVFKKYCRRAPILKGLIKYAGDAMKQCLGPEERESVDILYKIRSSMLEFVYYNQGERVSTFVDSGGIECLGFKGEALLSCVTQSFSGYSPNVFSVGAPTLGLENLEVPFVRGGQFCADVDRFRDCSVQVLNRCGDTATNMNLLKSAVDLIHKEIPCRGFLGETNSSAPERTPPDQDGVTGLSEIHNMRTVANEVFKQYFTEKCESNHTSTEYDIARVMPYYVSKYIPLLVENLSLIKFESISVTKGDKVEVVFKKFCRKVSTAEERVQLLAEDFGTCPYVGNQEEIDIVHNTTSAIQDYFCQEEGVHLARFMATNGTGCWTSMKRSIDSCVAEYFPTHVEPTTLYGPFKDPLRMCNYHVGMLVRCFVINLEYCEPDLPARKLLDLIEHLVRVVPCGYA